MASESNGSCTVSPDEARLGGSSVYIPQRGVDRGIGQPFASLGGRALIIPSLFSTSRIETTSEMLVLGTSTWWQEYSLKGGSK
jgi:hypothetical protein